MAAVPKLNREEARTALKEVVQAFTEPENLAKMNAAREEAGTDLLKMMQIVVPVATQIQQRVIEKYGFTSDQQGSLQFAQAIQAHVQDDTEIAQMSSQLKAMFLPPNMQGQR
ncbi:Protein C10 [Trichoplax sp. H2]|nr:Protein C10 [Trichoplax sp. H2]|eukprot:RDD45377.1 Protein C10 [Trichoplax sp. H2]